jgi:hypothetical protein
MLSSFYEVVGRFIPPWLQAILFSYLAIVLITWSMDKFRERRGIVLGIIYLSAAVFFAEQAVLIMMRLL